MARHLIVENSKCQLTPTGTAGLDRWRQFERQFLSDTQ